MRDTGIKLAVIALSVMLVLSLMNACGNMGAANNNTDPTAPETVVTASVVTLIADGRQITIEDAAGKTVSQLLEQARITLGAGDMLVLSPEQMLGGQNLVISVKKATDVVIPDPTDPTDPNPTDPTKPTPDNQERVVVSVEIYEDCDGSGHGVKIITYSDGTQEEEYF